MPNYKDYPEDLAKSDPLIPEIMKLPRSVLAVSTVIARRRTRTRQFILREWCTQASIEAQQNMDKELATEIAAEVKKRSSSSTSKKKAGSR